MILRHRTTYGFTLVELMIVVAILGIIAAIIIPEFDNHSQKAKEATAKENIRILRDAIERYSIRNNDIAPGYFKVSGGNYLVMPSSFYLQLIKGQYISAQVSNPFNGNNAVLVLQDDEEFPNGPTGNYGWIYKPLLKKIKLDWPGADSSGVSYFDY